jgi:hypothetical protein
LLGGGIFFRVIFFTVIQGNGHERFGVDFGGGGK